MKQVHLLTLKESYSKIWDSLSDGESCRFAGRWIYVEMWSLVMNMYVMFMTNKLALFFLTYCRMLHFPFSFLLFTFTFCMCNKMGGSVVFLAVVRNSRYRSAHCLHVHHIRCGLLECVWEGGSCELCVTERWMIVPWQWSSVHDHSVHGVCCAVFCFQRLFGHQQRATGKIRKTFTVSIRESSSQKI